MKTQSRNSSIPGFTLVELLVVIAIIATLAAASFGVGRTMIEKAKRVSAQSVASSISSAVDSFYSDYSALPVPNPASAPTADNTTPPYSTSGADSDNGVALLNALNGTESNTTSQNDRKIRYLSLKKAKGGNRDGATYNDTSGEITGLYDPWSKPYFIVLDYNYDDQITVNPLGPDIVLNGRKVAVYSLGTDGLASSKTLVKTW